MRAWGMATAAAAALATTAFGVAAAEDTPQPLTDRRPTVESAITTPIEDLNLKKRDIPEALQEAAANPYGVNGATSCEAIAAELHRLDAALGPDKDGGLQPSQGLDASTAAGGLLKAGVASFIPFRGVIREVTGANGQQRKIAETIEVGFARRGFLKGRALEMNCAPPAAPAWFKPAEAPVEDAPPQVAEAPTAQPAAPAELPTTAPAVQAAAHDAAPPLPQAPAAAPAAETPAPGPAPAGAGPLEEGNTVAAIEADPAASAPAPIARAALTTP